MDLAEAGLRFVVGGAAILFISLLSETEYRVLAGLFVLFPAVTVVGYYFYSLEVSQSQLAETVLFSIIAIPTVLAYLVAFYFSVKRFSVNTSLILGICGWMVVALIIVLLNQKYIGLGV